jgi:hypothetical protein
MKYGSEEGGAETINTRKVEYKDERTKEEKAKA